MNAPRVLQRSRVSAKAIYFGLTWARKSFPESFKESRVFENVIKGSSRHWYNVKFDIFEEMPDPVHSTHLKVHQNKDAGKNLPSDYHFIDGDSGTNSSSEDGSGREDEGGSDEDETAVVGGVTWTFAGETPQYLQPESAHVLPLVEFDFAFPDVLSSLFFLRRHSLISWRVSLLEVRWWFTLKLMGSILLAWGSNTTKQTLHSTYPPLAQPVVGTPTFKGGKMKTVTPGRKLLHALPSFQIISNILQ